LDAATTTLATQETPDRISVVMLIGFSALVTIVGTLGSFFGLHFTPRIGIDDAVITQIYARNIAQGFGYVYNVGGERVEGSTSPLWTLLNVFIFMIKEAWATKLLLALCWVMCFVSTLLTLLISTRAATMLQLSRRRTAVAAAVLMAACPAFFAWSVWSLMDVSIWILEITAFSTLAIGNLASDRPSRLGTCAISVLCVLIVLTRPEGVLIALAGAVGIYASYILKAPASWRATLLSGVSLLGLILFCYAGLTFWQYKYFGYPLPNTYYAKVSADHASTIKDGLSYVIHGVANMSILGAGILALSYLSYSLFDRFGKNFSGGWGQFIPVVPVFFIYGSVIAATIMEGGDNFAGFRLLQPITPICLAAVACVISGLLGSKRAPALPACVSWGVVVAISIAFITDSDLNYSSNFDNNISNEFKVANDGAGAGGALRALRLADGDFSIGVIGAGGAPYVFRGRAYDLEGLNWVAMAHASSRKEGPKGHQSFDRAIFFSTRPDIIPFGMVGSHSSKIYVDTFAQAALKGLFTDSEFRRLYIPIIIRKGGSLLGFASNAWLASHKPKDVIELSWDDVFVEGDS